MKNILIFGMNENPGGVESFIMSYFREFDKEQLHFDFLCNSLNKVAYENEIISMGSKVFHIVPRSKKPIQYYIQINQFFREYASYYDAIWVNINSLANIDYLKLAKKYGIKTRIVHSHNSRNMDTKLRGFLHSYNKRKIDKWATDFWACSEDAAKWFYGDRNLSEAKIIFNAIDIKKFQFSKKIRKKIRKEYKLENNFVIGNVGRLHFQKNQEFMLDIMAEYLRYDDSAQLVLIGQGEDEQKLLEKSEVLGITNHILFAGKQTNVSEWLSAFDLFLFPSQFEGLPIATLEAQANGVLTICSEKVVPEASKVNDNFFFFSLDKTASEWAQYMFKISKNMTRVSSDEIKKNFETAGYEILAAVEDVQNYFLKILE